PQEIWAAALDVCRHLLEQRLEHAEEAIYPPRLLDGGDLMQEFGLAPGPQIGQLLAAVREAQACGEIHTRQEALDFIKERLKSVSPPNSSHP
ncbi:MAG: hypothetical protein ACK8QZ_04985, partial [Anaerolineales bacterium]